MITLTKKPSKKPPAPKPPTLSVGSGGSVHVVDGRRIAVTIIGVSDHGRTLITQKDAAHRKTVTSIFCDDPYVHVPNPKGARFRFTFRKDGRWVERGKSNKNCLTFVPGERETQGPTEPMEPTFTPLYTGPDPDTNTVF